MDTGNALSISCPDSRIGWRYIAGWRCDAHRYPFFVFDAEKGLILNGKPYGQLVGANRHQDFAYVGNALPNSQQWRDAKRLRDAGCTIIRTAHYPQDPSFMDACDELGLFVICCYARMAVLEQRS